MSLIHNWLKTTGPTHACISLFGYERNIRNFERLAYSRLGQEIKRAGLGQYWHTATKPLSGWAAYKAPFSAMKELVASAKRFELEVQTTCPETIEDIAYCKPSQQWMPLFEA
jgi:hypothetical protein